MSTAPADDFQPGSEGFEQGTTADTSQNDYTSRTGQKQAPVPVQSDDDPIEDPIDAAQADSDEQLVKDDTDAVNTDNILGERTRGTTKNYREPGDDEGLGDPEDGSSAVAGGR